MSHQVTREGDVLKVAVSDVLNAETAPALQHDMATQIDGVKDIVFDLEGLTFVSSAGLRIFVAAYKLVMECGSVRFEHVGPEVMEVFELSGLADLVGM